MPERNSTNKGLALDLQQLKTFQTIATTGSFTQAARVLGYSQSNVTHQIQTLEQRLGLALIERERFSKGVVITRAGRRVLQHSERILELAQKLFSREAGS
jgi:molybdate transport repressor ModE-like protein